MNIAKPDLTKPDALKTSLLEPAVYVKGVYQNPTPTSVGRLSSMPKILWKALTVRERRVPAKSLGPFRTDVSLYRQPPTQGTRITWMGHSTLLLETGGAIILIDPVWSERASLASWIGPKRFYPPTLSLADLPPLDAVLLSHDHYDHLDARTIPKLIEHTPLFLCSSGVGGHLRRWGVPSIQIHELNWMDSFDIKPGLRLIALPARHFSGRGLKRFTTLWSSFVFRGQHQVIYYGADSGYYAGFAEIGEAFGPFDLTMLEIGAFDSLWPDIHLGPDNAAKAHGDLRGKILMPIHWGLFNLAFHAWNQPVERLIQLAEERQLRLFLPEPGKPTEFRGEAFSTGWWRR
jgi:L-ascorbate metabolism protein UlaG (beta-lactamase superfamily)